MIYPCRVLFVLPFLCVSMLSFGQLPDILLNQLPEALPSMEQLMDAIPSTHPRLIFNGQAEVVALRKKIATDPILSHLAARYLVNADAICKKPVGVFKLEGKRFRGASGTYMECLATAYLISGETRYVTRLEAEIRAVVAFPNWNPAHFLCASSLMYSMSLGYDWCYDALSPEVRNLASDAILRLGLIPSQKHWFWRVTNNWLQVCTAGVMAGSVAIYPEGKDVSGPLVYRSIASVPKSLDAYAPVGAYTEGPSYWEYGTIYSVIFNTMLQEIWQSDFGLSRAPGFRQSADYILDMTMPTGLFYGYADASSRRGMLTALYYFADLLERPDLLIHEAPYIDAVAKGSIDRPYAQGSFALLLKYYQPLPTTPIAPRAPCVYYEGHTPVAIFRTEPTAPTVAALAIKLGKSNQPHGHMDTGSFIYEANGVRWIHDIDREPYHNAEKHGLNIWSMSQKSSRWTIFASSTLAHSVPTLDDQPLMVDGAAKLLDFNAERGHISIDLSATYRNVARQAKRTIDFNPSTGQAVVTDDFRGILPAYTLFRDSLITFADATLSQDEQVLTLSQDNQSITITAQSSPANKKGKWVIESLAKARNPWDTDRPRLKRVSYTLPKYEQEGEGCVKVSLTFSPSKTQRLHD